MDAPILLRIARRPPPRQSLQCRRSPQSLIRRRDGSQPRRSYSSASASDSNSKSSGSSEKPKQARPAGQFYEALADQPLRTNEPSPAARPFVARTRREEIAARAKIVFGSRLTGPQRREQLNSQSKMVGGVMVPPRPEEPDNCCMSGCVNCVWDRYGEEIEEWAAKKREASAALARAKSEESARARTRPSPEAMHTTISMDDDGGGSETNWGMHMEDDPLKGVPVGIREFMKSEKRLREKHAREKTSA